MNQTIRDNVARLPFNYSTYVALAICYALDWWMDPANAGTKADLLQQYPFLVELGGPVSFGLWLLSRTWPQTPAPGAGRVAAVAPVATDAADTVPGVPLRLSLEETDAVLKAARILEQRGRTQ